MSKPTLLTPYTLVLVQRLALYAKTPELPSALMTKGPAAAVAGHVAVDAERVVGVAALWVDPVVAPLPRLRLLSRIDLQLRPARAWVAPSKLEVQSLRQALALSLSPSSQASTPGLHDAVAAARRLAVVAAGVGVDVVAVVASLSWTFDVVAAAVTNGHRSRGHGLAGALIITGCRPAAKLAARRLGDVELLGGGDDLLTEQPLKASG